jgi:disulfide bond formation protein DsbB
MCYWQRHVHKAVVIVAAIALILARKELPLHRAMTVLLVLLLLGSAALAFAHAGVEFKWWDGPKTCSGGGTSLPDFSSDDLFAKLDKKIQPPSCSDAVWVFLGLSMAVWNALISLGGAIVTAVLGFRHAKA